MMCKKVRAAGHRRVRIVSAMGLAGLVFAAATPAQAETEAAATAGALAALAIPTDEVIVVGDRVKRELADVEGAKIYAGKRAQVAVLADVPPIEGANFRQAFNEIPGLYASEVSNQSWASLSYRGMGEPHESWNILTLKDGVPISPDMYSYPAAYYTPPLDIIERIEVLQGGAGLLYGPQPGGVINYVASKPDGKDPYSGQLKIVGGSDNARSGLLGASFAAGPWRLYGYGKTAEGDGARRANSDFDQRSIALTGGYKGEGWSLSLGLDAFDAEYGEPGGLSRERFNADPQGGSTPVDRVFISRTAPRADLVIDAGAWFVEATAFAARYERTSRRQTGGAFGQVTPAANVAIRQTQDFETMGLDLRARRDFQALGSLQSATFGLLAFSSDAPVLVNKGATPTDTAGTAGALSRTDRETNAQALFGEVRLGLGPVIVTPGLRIEHIEQRVTEQLDLSTGSATGGPPGGPNGPLSAKASDETVVLWGLGAWVDLADDVRAVFNASTGYKPTLFNDGVTFASGVNAAPSLEPTRSLTIEAALKTRPREWAAFDVGVFWLRLEDQVGLLGGPLPALAPFGAVGVGGARRQTIGTLENHGFDVSGAVELFGPKGGPLGTRADALRLQANAQWLEAEVVSGAAAGNRPQYAPEWLARFSATYTRPNGAKLALFATYTDDQFGVDNGVADFAIPSATVVDASAEWPLAKGVAITAGVNNLFDEGYVARIRPGGGQGIDPGAPRNGYLGLHLKF